MSEPEFYDQNANYTHQQKSPDVHSQRSMQESPQSPQEIEQEDEQEIFE